ncbi:unnamed protein product [Orchesella dallaii]|uniref:Uncharacterized protein n=1 Tax=Orchesella dallaii TaxID=48710 RepID=A0ABP1PVU8_9HEXA
MNYLNCCCLVLALSSFLFVVISASTLSSQELKDPTTEEDLGSTISDTVSKRAWKNLGAAWGKRAWADMQKAWGKRRGWDRLSAAWGKRMAPSDFASEPSNDSDEVLYGMDKRPEWSSLKGSWGKRATGHSGWSNLKGSWGKRAAWNKLDKAWGKRSTDSDDETGN